MSGKTAGDYLNNRQPDIKSYRPRVRITVKELEQARGTRMLQQKVERRLLKARATVISGAFTELLKN